MDVFADIESLRLGGHVPAISQAEAEAMVALAWQQISSSVGRRWRSAPPADERRGSGQRQSIGNLGRCRDVLHRELVLRHRVARLRRLPESCVGANPIAEQRRSG